MRYCWPLFLVVGLLSGLGSFSAAAQTRLSGTVTDAQHQPIPGALVEVQALPASAESGVTVTDEQGRFTCQVAFTADSLLLSVRSLGFREQTRRLRNQPQSVVLELPPSTTQLKEVTVKAPPVRREGDTLSYRVSAFTGQKDRVIADVLRRLPGMEVEADGRILYEGRPIQKFYINGADLLESRYNLASNNLPAEAVQDVQVLKRHQPIAALRGVQQSEQASLNLDLKKKVTATGQARVGLGAAPALWNVNLAPMLFTPRQQLIDTYQTNNTGQDVAAEVQPLDANSLQQLLEPGNRKPELTGIQALSTPPLESRRYLFNRAHLLSANHLLPFSKDAQLRINATYLHDRQTQTGSTQTRFSLPEGGAVTLREEKHNTLYTNQFTTDWAYIRNVAQYYLKNTLRLAGSWDAQDGVVRRSSSETPIQQRATNPAYLATNRLGMVRPAGGARLLQVNSVLTLAASPQQLSTTAPPSGILLGDTIYTSARQQARMQTFYTANSVALLTGRQHWHFTYSAGFTEHLQHLTSWLAVVPTSYPAAPDTLRNLLTAHQGRYYTQAALDYKTNRLHLELETPLSFRTYQAEDSRLEGRQQRRFISLEPQFSGRLELNGRWHARSSLGFSNELSPEQPVYYGYLLRDYRTLQRNAAPLTQTRTLRFSGGLYYENPLTSWFYRATYSYSTFTRNQLTRTVLRPDGTLTSLTFAQLNRGATQTVAGSASKFLSEWKMSLDWQLNASFMHQPIFLNNQLTEARTQTGAARFKTTLNGFTWGGLEYTAALSSMRSRLGTRGGSTATTLQQQLALSWYPADRHSVVMAGDYYQSNGLSQVVRNVFLDATYRYTLPTARKLDVELKASNLLDSRRYQTTYVSEFILVQNEYQLRPRQFLVNARVSF